MASRCVPTGASPVPRERRPRGAGSGPNARGALGNERRGRAPRFAGSARPRRRAAASTCAVAWLALAPALSAPAPPGPSQPQAVDAAAPRYAIAFEKYTLANGLEVILHHDPRLASVALNLWYHVGPANEPPGRSGFAHLFEHLMFEGSRHAGDRFDELLESVGATNVNGTTSFDRTNYFETVPAEALELALWLESDRMGYLVFSTERLEAQREIVLNERRQSYENRPYGPSDLALYDGLFPKGHPYHGNVIGSVEDLERATLDDVRAFHASYYAPSNATLTLAGAFAPQQAKAWIEKYFATLPARPAPERRRYSTPALPSAQRTVVPEPVRLPRVSMAWIVPPAFAPQEAAIELALEVLGSGKSSRLYQRLVRTGLAMSVSTWLDDAELASVAGIEVMLPEGGSPAVAEAAVREELKRLAEAPPSSQELRRSVKGLLVGLASSLQLLDTRGGDGGRAGLLQKLNHYLGDPGALPEVIQRLENTTAEEARRATGEFLAPDRCLTVVTEPRAAGVEAGEN